MVTGVVPSAVAVSVLVALTSELADIARYVKNREV
jgi:hypothetical protein